MQYLQIQIKGYKSLADITLDLHPLTVMIGPNGCGKTSFLEVWHLLKRAAQARMAETIENLGGLNSVLTQIKGEAAKLEIAVRVGDISPRFIEPMTFSFVLSPQNGGYFIESQQWEPRNPAFPGYVPPQTAATELSQLMYQWGSDSDSPPSKFSFATTLFLSSLDVGQRSPIRLPQTLVPATYPGPNGETLFAALFNLRESLSSKSSFARIEETVRLAFSDFDHFELRVVGAGQITLEWYQANLAVPLYPSQLSEGTLRFLWLTTVLLSPEPPPLILIDEPELSLHPELLQILAALLRDASARTQLLVATHSSDLIRWLRPDEVVVIDKQEGKSKFTWANDPSLDLENWLKEYTLADLWLMGNLGGRP